MFIVYEGENEILITKKKKERAFLKDCFEEGSGRNIEEYDRTEIYDDCVIVTNRGM